MPPMSPKLLTVLIVVPAAAVVIVMFVMMWRRRTSIRTAVVAVLAGVVLAGWMLATSVLAVRGFYLPPVTGVPPVGLQLVIVLVVSTLLLIVSPSLRSLLTSQKNLIRLNVWRLVGAVFLALMFTRQVAALWALPAGLGDVLVGAFAFPVASGLEAPGGRRRARLFNLLGLLDLVVAVGLGVAISPGPTRLIHVEPSTAIMTQFPMVLVPTFLVPLAFMVHLVSLWQLSGRRWAAPTA